MAAPAVLDLFCGVGGLALGFRDAGARIVGAFDVEARHVRAYNHNVRAAHGYVADLATATAEELLAQLPLSHGKLDIVIGGPPCQGFSSQGRRRPDDPRNSLILRYAQLIADIRPKVFVMENVAGLVEASNRELLRQFAELIRAAGYQLRLPIQVLNAADFGVPQRRRRVIVLGALQGHKVPQYPPRLPNRSSQRPTVEQAIGDLPCVGDYPELYDSEVFVGALGNPSEYAMSLRTARADSHIHRLTGCKLTRHSPEVVRRFSKTKPGSQEPISRYHRLAPTGISPTLCAGSDSSHGKHTAPRPIHYTAPRCITVREAARLHSFPDSFQFDCTIWHAFRQVGSSVPPRFARAIAYSVLASL